MLCNDSVSRQLYVGKGERRKGKGERRKGKGEREKKDREKS